MLAAFFRGRGRNARGTGIPGIFGYCNRQRNDPATLRNYSRGNGSRCAAVADPALSDYHVLFAAAVEVIALYLMAVIAVPLILAFIFNLFGKLVTARWN